MVVGIGGDTIVKNFPPEISLLAYLELRCAALGYKDGAVTVGEATAGGSIGDPTGDSVGPFDCEDDRVASGMRVYAGDILDAVAARCEPVSIRP